ncbi:hypothetical protein CC2G_013382 [Coprinopsis cinerea AmutBmut pab1-1]|nr:hypothetical protein CC2G_013382 [Coprinopsis cinerea AmutBmut pab1-1]
MLFTAALATFCTVWIIGFPVFWAPELDGNQYSCLTQLHTTFRRYRRCAPRQDLEERLGGDDSRDGHSCEEATGPFALFFRLRPELGILFP